MKLVGLTCFAAIFLEGLAIYGITPFIGEVLGQGSSHAGYVISALGLGGLIYSTFANQLTHLIQRGSRILLGGGTAAVALGIAGASQGSQLAVVCFFATGFGFLMLHTEIFAIATDLFPSSRATTTALLGTHFFAGQATGPLMFAWTLPAFGTGGAFLMNGGLILAAAVAVGVGFSRQSSGGCAAAIAAKGT